MSMSAAVVKDNMKGRMTVGLVALRVIIGVVFIVSGLAKMWDTYSFAEIVRSYGFLPESLVVPVAILIPSAEFFFGLMLLLSEIPLAGNFHPRTASISLLLMVVIFTGLSAVKYFSQDFLPIADWQ